MSESTKKTEILHPSRAANSLGYLTIHKTADFREGDKKAPRRVEKLANTVITNAGGAWLVQPDSSIVARIAKETNGRVEYFPTADTEVFRRSDLLPEYQKFREVYAEAVTQPLARKIQEDFPDRVLSLRVVQASINGHEPDTYYGAVSDVSEIMAHGTEKAGQRVKTAIMDINRPESTDVISEFAVDAGIVRGIQEETSPEVAENLFPVVLAYDAHQLAEFATQDGEEAADLRNALVKAYIVDAPMMPPA